MKKYLFYFFSLTVLVLSGCDKSIVEPTPALKLASQQTLTTGKVEFYNHIGNQGTIYIYVDGNYIKSLSYYFSSSTYFGCGYSTDTDIMCKVDNLEEGSHHYEIRNSSGTSIIVDYFDIYRGGCTPINLFY